jgi:3-phosphoshikimate 1-carboxyvinyltransferase
VRRVLRTAKSLSGDIHTPGDKSISHRSLILNSIARGDARISGFSQAADCFSTLSCLRALDVDIEDIADGGLLVHGKGELGFHEPDDVIDAGNSGTTMRLMTGLLAAQPFLSVITGDGSLRSRPMARIIQPLRLMGARIWGRRDDSCAPLVIKGGPLNGIDYRLPVASAQLKSALIIAGLFADGDTIVEEPMQSRDHTERMLGEMGANIKETGTRIAIAKSQLKAKDISVPGDISSAAFWLVAGAVHSDANIRLLNTGLNPTRCGVIDVLRSMGVNINVENERFMSSEPVADLDVKSSSLAGIEIGGDIIPLLIDEIPLIALAASLAKGKTVIKNAEELRVKESDRITSTVQELSKLGARIEEMEDGMVIHGADKLRGSECDSHGDHRLAMMLGIASLVAEGETGIDNSEAADISYPTFWKDLEMISRN